MDFCKPSDVSDLALFKIRITGKKQNRNRSLQKIWLKTVDYFTLRKLITWNNEYSSHATRKFFSSCYKIIFLSCWVEVLLIIRRTFSFLWQEWITKKIFLLQKNFLFGASKSCTNYKKKIFLLQEDFFWCKRKFSCRKKIHLLDYKI